MNSNSPRHSGHFSAISPVALTVTEPLQQGSPLLCTVAVVVGVGVVVVVVGEGEGVVVVIVVDGVVVVVVVVYVAGFMKIDVRGSWKYRC